VSKDLQSYTKEELLEYIQRLKKTKKFGLVWEDKPEQVVKDVETKLPVLEELVERAITDSPDSPTHLIIEGDNYHSLSTLNYTHAGKVNIIYIDPPYNTGNKDFIYNDHYIDREDSFRHSKWLSFMSRRLELAKALLSEDGLIFISIDENEYANLKLLCDQIFNNNNFVNSFVWINNLKGRQISGIGAAGTHEYILAYAKNVNSISQFEGSAQFLKSIMPSTYKGFNYKTQIDEHGEYVVKNELYNSNSIFNETTRPNLVYDIYFNPLSREVICEDVSENHLHVDYVKVSPKKNNSGRAKYHAWRWGRNKVLNESHNLEFLEAKSGYKVYTKVRTLDRTIVKDVVTDINTTTGAQDINALFDKGTFDFPKPVDLIKFVISLSDNPNALILDFFAGSGTTGQSVLELNRYDKGKRQFILCTNNENGIAENITYQRIKKVAQGHEKVEAIPTNVRYFKTDFVSKQKTDDQTRLAIVDRCTDMIRIRENTFEEVINESDMKLFTDKNHCTAIIFDPLKIPSFIKRIEELNLGKPVNLYIFSYSTYTYDEDIPETSLDFTTCSIPESVLEVYQRIFKTEER